MNKTNVALWLDSLRVLAEKAENRRLTKHEILAMYAAIEGIKVEAGQSNPQTLTDKLKEYFRGREK